MLTKHKLWFLIAVVFASLFYSPTVRSEPTIEYEKIEYIQEKGTEFYSFQLTKKAEKLRGTHQGQCTTAVRNFLGLGADEIQGLAKNNEPNSENPEVGSVIITDESKYGHVGVVLYFTDTTVTFYESNVPMGSEIAGIRTLQLNDPRIVGYKIIN